MHLITISVLDIKQGCNNLYEMSIYSMFRYNNEYFNIKSHLNPNIEQFKIYSKRNYSFPLFLLVIKLIRSKIRNAIIDSASHLWLFITPWYVPWSIQTESQNLNIHPWESVKCILILSILARIAAYLEIVFSTVK